MEKKNKNKSLIKEFILNEIKTTPLYWRTILFLLLIAIFVKTIIVYFSHLYLNPRSTSLSYLASDIPVLVMAQLVVNINFRIKNRNYRLIWDAVIFTAFLLFCIDIFTIYFFQSRVVIPDMFALWSNGTSGFWWVVLSSIIILIVLEVIIFLVVQSLNPNYKNTNRKWVIIVFSICLLWYSAFYSILKLSNIYTEFKGNIITLNWQLLHKSDTSDLDGINDLDDNKILSYQDYITTVEWEWKKMNIILVFAESLSAIDSENAGWYNNMPYFDLIQKEWITYTNFIENWATSDTAHIATLFGLIPLINIWSDDSTYSGYKLLMPALPEFLNNQWYNTTFVSAVSLNFLNQRDFLSEAWFQKIIWEEEFYDKKKYTFDSAPDEDLYNRVLQEIDSQTWTYFIWLQTISFHKPYNTPKGDTQELALQYSDEELYKFYLSLKNRWFFENGILVILWDHRMTNPIQEWEYDKFWDNWHVRTVATVVWTGINPWEINSNIIQHSDFYYSIKKLVWNWLVQVEKLYNDVFSSTINRNRAITNRRYSPDKRYFVSYVNWNSIEFNNISTLFKQDKDIYKYFSSYMKYELIDFPEESNSSTGTILIGHQWAPRNAPENTLESFLTAKSQWAKGIEFDVSYTKDRKNIVAHWELMSASDCKKLKIQNYDYDWIQENCTLKNWEKYKTLREMLELIDGLFDYYFLEIKVIDESLWAEQALDIIQTVKDMNMQDRVIFISYSDAARAVLNADSDIIFGWDTFDVNDVNFVWENNSKYFLAPYSSLSAQVIEKAKEVWKIVATYTVNTTEDFQNMKDRWVDIILTDKIWLLRNYEKIWNIQICDRRNNKIKLKNAAIGWEQFLEFWLNAEFKL